IPFAENVPVVQTTTDAAQIQTTIAQLSANDNGLSNTDCPEASLQAVSSIASSIQGGDILLFTDDLPKDPALWSSQSFLALQRAQAKLHSIILPKTCGRSSPADWLPYRSLSLISGGSYQSVTTDKTEAALQIVLSEMRANTDLGPSPQSIVHTKTNGVVQTATAEVYEVVVDDTVSEANFLLNVLEGSFTLTLFDPAGHLIDAMAPTVQLIDSGSAQYYTITDPQPGIWRAQILGDGDFVFRSSADSLIEYTYLGETYASPGKMMQLVARVTGPISRVSFEVENTNGTVVDSVQLKDNGTLGDFSAGDGVYTGFYTPTTTADLQMRVIGETEAGTAFLRGDPRLIRVRSLSIEAPPAIDVTTDGTYRLDFSIQNTGSQAETYELESLAQYVTIEQGPPQFITVQPQSSVIVPVTIHIPPDGLPNGSDAVRVTAVAQHDQTLIAEGATAVFVPEKETSPFSNIYLPVIRSPSACDTGNSPPVDVIFVLDRSGSMLEDNRFEEAKNALRTFINQMDFSREQAGLVSFSSDARLEQMLTNDRDALNSAISRLEVDGPTAIGDGIAAAMSELQSSRHRPTHQSVMIVLSDGQNNMGQEPLPIATAAKSAGIRIFTIALGGSADTGLLQQIASSPTDFYAAPNASNLDAIYQTIAGVVRCVTQTVVNTLHS
ncbi:MAG TPA: VWA domain-containing protein, partial [Caldilineaceae bacterium]|nr:VWA domain-containing protein [Caldilineaceae bacterium]